VSAALPGGFTHLTLGRLVRASAARAPDKTALICADKQLTYRQLVRRMNQVAALARHGWGLQPGDRVALLAPNCPEYLELVLGLSDVGAIVATLNNRLSAAELAAILADCTPRVLLVHPSCAALVDKGWAADMRIVMLDASYDALLLKASDRSTEVAVPEWAAFGLAYTSGTTGLPKGVLLPHRSRALTFLGMAAEYSCFGVDDHFLVVTPLSHGAGFVFGAAPLALGGTVTILPGFEPIDVLDRLASGVHTGVFMVPTLFHRWFALPSMEVAKRPLKNIKAIISNAAALPQPTKELIVAAFGPGLLHETYGSTEAGIVTNIRPADQLRKSNSVGTPFPMMEVELRDETGAVVGDGAVGELFCRGPYSFNGYWNCTDDTAETLRDGWITVGDMAVRDAEGFYHIVDRKKDMVISGGINIYPREIENVIATLSGVGEVAVVGLPDPEWGERVHAFIVAKGPPPKPDAVIDACRARLAGYKVPRGISFISELPRNAGGKILKKDLRQRGAV
jgi:acyl-CoA synthetase (AMP-forming)/AMP-acid ligase II